MEHYLQSDPVKNKQMQPYLLAKGLNKREIAQYFIIVDHKAIPCAGNCFEACFDALFKSQKCQIIVVLAP